MLKCDICVTVLGANSVGRGHKVERLQIPVIALDAKQAQIAASLWKRTRAVDMSVGDRACISLATNASMRGLRQKAIG